MYEQGTRGKPGLIDMNYAPLNPFTGCNIKTCQHLSKHWLPNFSWKASQSLDIPRPFWEILPRKCCCLHSYTKWWDSEVLRALPHPTWECKSATGNSFRRQMLYWRVHHDHHRHRRRRHQLPSPPCHDYCTVLYSTLFYSTLPYSTLLHSTPLHSTPLHSNPIRSALLYSTLLHSTPLHSTPLHSTPLHSTPLQSALLYSTLLYSTLPYSTLLYSTLLYSTLLYSTLLYSTLLYSTLLYSTLLYSTLLYSTLLYSTLLYSTLLYSTLLCSTLLYSTLLYSTLVYPALSYSVQSSLVLRYFNLLSFNYCSIFSRSEHEAERFHSCVPSNVVPDCSLVHARPKNWRQHRWRAAEISLPVPRRADRGHLLRVLSSAWVVCLCVSSSHLGPEVLQVRHSPNLVKTNV